MAHAVILGSDGHTASTFGLWPPDALADTEGGKHANNAWQKYIWECHQHAVNEWLPSVCGNQPRILILGGDMVDGLQAKSPICTDDGNLQVAAAVMAWGPLAKTCEKVYAVSGTEFHAGKSATWDNAVAMGLGAQLDATERAARWQLWLTVDGVTFDVAHHVGGSHVPASRYTPLQREYVEAAVSCFDGDWPHADWIVRGHGHMYRLLQGVGSNVLTLPGWQARTPFAHKIRRGIPFDIGLVVIICDEGRSELHHKLYKWPMPIIEEVGCKASQRHNSPTPSGQPSSGSRKKGLLSRLMGG